MESASSSGARNRLCCAKILRYVGRGRNRVQPTRPPELRDAEFFEVAPRRILHVLRPALKSERFYEPPAKDRPESINDNFYTRWGRRPHPSGNCRCSFRQSRNSSRLSSHEEVMISQEIQRIRTSLCEAERNGKDIEEVEKSLALDLTQLAVAGSRGDEAAGAEAESLAGSRGVQSRIESLDEQVRQRIVKDLDRYISDLLDEILSDTIRAIAKADNPFGSREQREAQPAAYPPTFDIKFSFHGSEDEAGKAGATEGSRIDEEAGIKGYVNQGFVGSVNDPDALDFHLRRRLGNDRALDSADCVDSGINSVETVELQAEQEQNLEQSLMDIIDAKLGGSSIGKSLENLGMEIDATDDCEKDESVIADVPSQSSRESEVTEDSEPTDESKGPRDERKPMADKCPEGTASQRSSVTASERASKSLDDVIEEPAFTSLRLEFKQSNGSIKEPESKPRRKVASRFNKTLSMIRRRLVRRLNTPRRKRSSPSDSSSKSSKASPSASFKSASARAQLRPDDLHRRRFPVPPTRRPESLEAEVTLRRRSRKPTIVFLHGFGSSADTFSAQLSYFAELGYPCLAPDLMGHGFSSAPRRAADYHFDRLLKDLEELLLHYAFRPGQKCVIVAHNYGCSFATALGQKYASNVHQLVLISGGGPIPLAPPPSPEGPGHCFLRSCLTPFLFCGMSRGVMYSARGRQHPYCGPEEAPWASTHMRHVLRGMSWPEGDHVFLRRICTPTLLVHGLRDNKVSLVQECQMERTMGKAVLEAIPSAGHMPMTDCPDQLNHMIHCFIDLWKNKKW